MLRVPEGHQRETEDQRQTRLHIQQSRDYNHSGTTQLIIISLSPHVFIGTMTEGCAYCKTLEFNGETKEICCAAEKLNYLNLMNHQSH